MDVFEMTVSSWAGDTLSLAAVDDGHVPSASFLENCLDRPVVADRRRGPCCLPTLLSPTTRATHRAAKRRRQRQVRAGGMRWSALVPVIGECCPFSARDRRLKGIEASWAVTTLALTSNRVAVSVTCSAGSPNELQYPIGTDRKSVV